MTDELPLYSIPGWNDYFENSKSRQRDQCAWVATPNKHGGRGWMAVVCHPDGAAIYGIWKMLIEYCSRQRRPREGYLTANGKRDGMRMPAAEIARMFHRPTDEVRRALRILSSPEVGWLELVEGVPEIVPPQVPEEVTAKTDTPPVTPSASKSATERDRPSASGSDTESASKSDSVPGTERKKERMNFSLSGQPVNEQEADPQHSTPKEPEEVTAETDTAGASKSDAGSASKSDRQSDLIQHAEAKRLFGELSAEVFGNPIRENQWSNKMDHELCEFLPMKRADWELMDWFYRLPDDHEIFRITFKRQSLDSLIENLSREVQKIRTTRKKLGLNGLHEKNAAELSEEWTPKRADAFKKLYGETDPGPFHLLDRGLREQIDAEAQI